MSDPNVTITFTGSGEGAVKAAESVGNALSSLAAKSVSARSSLQAVAAVMDTVASRAAKVQQLGAAYQSAAGGIHAATMQSERSAQAFTRMAAAAATAQAKVDALNQASAKTKQPKTPSAPRQAGESSDGGGGMMVLPGVGGSLAGMAKMAVQMTGLTVGAATVGNEIRKLIAANMDLDSAMSSVAAVGALEKTGTVYRELTDLVMHMGRTTQYSAVEAATGLKELIAAGYDAETAGRLLGDTLSLAATENMEMGRASEIVVASLQSFRLGAEESTRVTDVLARAANASTASIDGMGEALKYLAPVAASMKISMEEASAAVAILSNNGIQAGLAGRGLSAMMARMIGPTKDAQEVIESFGLTIADINPEVVGMGQAFAALNKIDNAGLVKLFGAENLDVANIAKSNAAGFDDMVAKMKDVEITAKGMAALKNDNLAGDWKKMKAAINDVRIALGKDLYAAIRKHVKSFTGYVNENKTALLQAIRAIGRMSLVAGQLAVAYGAVRMAMAAVKAVSLVPQLIETASRFGMATAATVTDTAAVNANTAAVEANAAARKSGTFGKFSGAVTVGAAVGGMAGYQSAPENASGAETAARTIGGAVAGGVLFAGAQAAGTKLISLVAQGMLAAKPVVMGAVTSLVSYAGGLLASSTVGGAGVIASLSAAGAAGVATFGALALAAGGVGYAIGSISSEPLQRLVFGGELLVDVMNKGIDGANEYGNQLVSAGDKAIRNANTQAELDKAKENITRNIAGLKAQIASDTESGVDQEEIDIHKTTIQLLEQKLKFADRIFEKRQAEITAAAELAKWEEDNAKFQKEAARQAQIRAVAMENMIAAAKKMQEGLPDIAKTMTDAKQGNERLRIYSGKESDAVGAAQGLREGLEAELKKNGVKLDGIIDPAREIKSADDVAAYYAAVIGAIRKSGNENAFGVEGMAALRKAWEDANAAKAGKKSAQSEVDKTAQDEISKAQELAKIKADIAINEAKASGDTKRAEKLEREQAILEEQARIFKLLDKPGAADDAAANAKAKEIATRKVDAELMANGKGGNDPNASPAQLGAGAKAVNLLFGRSVNAGMLEEAKRQTTYLKEIAAALSIKDKPKLEAVFA